MSILLATTPPPVWPLLLNTRTGEHRNKPRLFVTQRKPSTTRRGGSCKPRNGINLSTTRPPLPSLTRSLWGRKKERKDDKKRRNANPKPAYCRCVCVYAATGITRCDGLSIPCKNVQSHCEVGFRVAVTGWACVHANWTDGHARNVVVVVVFFLVGSEVWCCEKFNPLSPALVNGVICNFRSRIINGLFRDRPSFMCGYSHVVGLVPRWGRRGKGLCSVCVVGFRRLEPQRKYHAHKKIRQC